MVLKIGALKHDKIIGKIYRVFGIIKIKKLKY